MCGQTYDSGGEGHGGILHTFSRTIGEGGYKHVRLRRRLPWGTANYDVTEEWKVDRKWHPIPQGGGRLASATCNSWNKQGYRILDIYEKNPDGSGRTATRYYVDSEGVGWEETYQVWWKGDTMYEKQFERIRCNRET